MTEYLVSPNLGLSTSVNARMNTLLGYPNPATKTDQYAEPQEHASDSGTYLLIIKGVWSPLLNRQATISDIKGELSPAELSAIKSGATLEAEGAFPAPTP